MDPVLAARYRALAQAALARPGCPFEDLPANLAVVDVPRQRMGLLRESKPDTRFQCDGRTHCSEMTSCAEARYFLEHCPGTQMDGDGDGRPCESQHCN